jgi:hypothetical protein
MRLLEFLLACSESCHRSSCCRSSSKELATLHLLEFVELQLLLKLLETAPA